MRYEISFVEEAIMNSAPKYYKCVGGRIEIYDMKRNDGYASEEIHFVTNKLDEYYKLRDKLDLKIINQRQLIQLKDKIEKMQLGV